MIARKLEIALELYKKVNQTQNIPKTGLIKVFKPRSDGQAYYETIAYEDVVYIEKEGGDKIMIYTKQGTKHSKTTNLTPFLKEYKCSFFLQISQSIVINSNIKPLGFSKKPFQIKLGWNGKIVYLQVARSMEKKVNDVYL